MRKWKENEYVPSVLSILTTTCYPALFVFLLNADQTNLESVLPAVGIFAGEALAIWAVLVICKMPVAKAAVVSNIAALCMQNYSFLEKAIRVVLPNAYYWHIVYVLIMLVTILGIVVAKKITVQTAALVDSVIAAVFGVLIVINLISALPHIVERIENKRSDVVGAGEIQDAGNRMANVYYFLFDEYSGPDGLEYYCNDDDSDFYSALEELNFNISYHSYNEFCEGEIGTINIVPNLLNLKEVVTPEMSYNQKSELMKSPYLYQIMHKEGYSIHVIDVWDFFDKESADSYYENSDLVNSSELSPMSIAMSKTVWYPFYKNNAGSEIATLSESFDEAAKSYKIGQEKNSFVLGYWCFPHIPYFVDQDGNEIDGVDRYNVKDYSLYLSQLKYAGKCIVDTVTEIIENDKDSIIILQSDHGFRPSVHLNNVGEAAEVKEEEVPHMKNILNAVYYMGNDFAIEGLDGLATLNKVFDELTEEEYEQ